MISSSLLCYIKDCLNKLVTYDQLNITSLRIHYYQILFNAL